MELDPALAAAVAGFLFLVLLGFFAAVLRLRAHARAISDGPPPPAVVEIHASFSPSGRLRGARLVELERQSADGSTDKPGVRLHRAAAHLLDFTDSIRSVTACRRPSKSMDHSQQLYEERLAAARAEGRRLLRGKSQPTPPCVSLLVRTPALDVVRTVTRPSQEAVPETLQALRRIPAPQVFQMDLVVRRP